MNEHIDRIVRQAIRRNDTPERSVCVSRWLSGKVTEAVYATNERGYTSRSGYTPIDRSTTWNERDFYALVETGKVQP